MNIDTLILTRLIQKIFNKKSIKKHKNKQFMECTLNMAQVNSNVRA